MQTRNRSGQTTDATNFRSDVNADGFINSGDQIVRALAVGNGPAVIPARRKRRQVASSAWRDNFPAQKGAVLLADEQPPFPTLIDETMFTDS